MGTGKQRGPIEVVPDVGEISERQAAVAGSGSSSRLSRTGCFETLVDAPVLEVAGGTNSSYARRLREGKESRPDNEHVASPERHYDCPNYDVCLGLAAALDWSSFTCSSCSGSIDQKTLWRAHHRVRNNAMLAALCNLPDLSRMRRKRLALTRCARLAQQSLLVRMK